LKSLKLQTQLTNLSAHKKSRLEVSNWVIENPESLKELLNYCFKIDEDISYKSAWVLEYVCNDRLDLLIPHLTLFLKNIPKAYKNQSIRPFSKICLMLVKSNYIKKESKVIAAMNLQIKKAMTECSFDWLISNQKVASQAYAMDTLYLLGTEIDWIHPELKIIIEQNIPNKTAAYKARGRMTLEKISKFQNKGK